MLVAGGSGGVSGGTIDSLLNTDLTRAERKLARDPYCLNPSDKRCNPPPPPTPPSLPLLPAHPGLVLPIHMALSHSAIILGLCGSYVQ